MGVGVGVLSRGGDYGTEGALVGVHGTWAACASVTSMQAGRCARAPVCAMHESGGGQGTHLSKPARVRSKGGEWGGGVAGVPLHT